MDQTNNLSMPYILPSQAQKHVTHNEALGILDAVVQLAIVDRTHTSPPSTPTEGERYIVASAASGPWAGHDDEIAHFLDGSWAFIAPREGFLAWDAAESQFVTWIGSAWTATGQTIPELQNVELMGVGTTADSTNPFAAKLNKALWTAKTAAEGGDGDLRFTMNKETTADTLSLLMQTAYSARAEIGLLADDNLTFKVSDGATSRVALSISKDNAKVRAGDALFTSSTLNIKGKALASASDGYFCITVTNTNNDSTNKGGAVLTCAQYSNANKPFLALAPWSQSNANVLYYGGGGWGCPDATGHQFYTGAHNPTADNTSTLAFQLTAAAVLAWRNTAPATDNTYSLGTGSLKWSVVYSNTGTINTSDARLKDVEGPVPLGLAFLRDLEPVAYRWKVGGHELTTEMAPAPDDRPDVGPVAVDRAMPKPGGRTHYGLIAQQVRSALDSYGVDFAGWTLADKDDPDSEQGLRYDQFVPILIKAVQELSAEVEALKARSA
ncbi:MAG: DUF2793 domain-containing protein [Rhizobiaceae bacterium]